VRGKIELAECMVRRLTAREKLVDEESLRQCIRPVCGDVSPGHDEIRRVPVLISLPVVEDYSQAQDFLLATATSICRSKLTIRSAVCFFPRAIPGSSHTS
jgi:hypothetical protein